MTLLLRNKVCSKCCIKKLLVLFNRNKDSVDGYRSVCKDCDKAYRLLNYDKLLIQSKSYYARNRETIQKKDRARLPQTRIRRQIRFIVNHSEIRRKDRAYRKKRMSEDIEFKLRSTLSHRLLSALKGGYKHGTTVDLLGCSIKEFKNYLEKLFQPGMCWKNHGIHGWHIDHIKPMSKFNLSKLEEQREACHYTNLQPLWALDNIRKSNKDITFA